MLQCLGIAWQLDVNDERYRRKVDSPRGDIGRDAHPRALIAQCLQRMVTLRLAMLARQRHRLKAALGQARMEAADRVARRAEQDRGLGLMKAQQIDDGMLDVGRCHRHRLVGDVLVAFLVTQRLDPERILLIAPGERDNRPGHRRREQQGAPSRRGRVEDFLELFAKAHVEHLVGLVEHRHLERRHYQRSALEVVA